MPGGRTTGALILFWLTLVVVMLVLRHRAPQSGDSAVRIEQSFESNA